MTFTLACITAALYGASSQVLSLDRTVGGRLFAGTIFLGCILSGGIVGFAVVSISWLARGDGVKAILEYFPADLQEIPSRREIGELKEDEKFLENLNLTAIQDGIDALSKALALPIPSIPVIENAVRLVFEVVDGFLTEPTTAYWVLLIILYTIFSFPFAFCRGIVEPKFGLMLAIATLFMGSQVVFGTLMPILGQRLFWTQVTAGYIKVSLVNLAAMVINGLFFFASSSHDRVRTKLGDVLVQTGKLLSVMGSRITFIRETCSDPYKNQSREKALLVDSAEHWSRKMRKQAMAFADSPEQDESSQQFPEIGGTEAGSKMRLLGQYSTIKNTLELQADVHSIEGMVSVCLFEPPIPGVSSQWGAKPDAYKEVLASVRKVLSVVSCLEASYLEFSFDTGSTNTQDAKNCICGTLAAAAASMSSAASVLQDMPLGKKCYGNSLKWRPQSSEYWDDLRNKIEAAASGINLSLPVDEDLGEVDDDGVPLKLVRYQSLFLAFIASGSLIDEVEQMEATLSIALDIASVSDADQNKVKPSLVDRLKGNPYFPSVGIHCLLLSSAMVWGLIFSGFKTSCAFIQSKGGFWRNRQVQYGLKYWLSLSVTIMAIILVVWLGKGNTGQPIEDAESTLDFFLNWQPVYFSITAAICVQWQVESSAFRAVLRSSMTFLGGLFGYLTMLNGNLAQNPYFVISISCCFNGVCGFLSPIKEFRYSLFLTAFTFNAVVICQVR